MILIQGLHISALYDLIIDQQIHYLVFLQNRYCQILIYGFNNSVNRQELNYVFDLGLSSFLTRKVHVAYLKLLRPTAFIIVVIQQFRQRGIKSCKDVVLYEEQDADKSAFVHNIDETGQDYLSTVSNERSLCLKEIEVFSIGIMKKHNMYKLILFMHQSSYQKKKKVLYYKQMKSHLDMEHIVSVGLKNDKDL